MTRNQIKKSREYLPEVVPGKVTEYTAEQKQLKEELYCREMINSILCYHGKRDIEKNKYLTKYILSLGMTRVHELIKEQISDFKKAKVVHNVQPGYHAIIWADEK